MVFYQLIDELNGTLNSNLHSEFNGKSYGILHSNLNSESNGNLNGKLTIEEIHNPWQIDFPKNGIVLCWVQRKPKCVTVSNMYVSVGIRGSTNSYTVFLNTSVALTVSKRAIPEMNSSASIKHSPLAPSLLME